MTRYFLAILLLLAVLPELHAQMEYQTTEVDMTPRRRELFFYGMRAYPFGKIPQGARLDALYQMQFKMKPFGGGGQSAQASNQWQQLGPFNVGGRIRSIVVHPTDGQTLWAGAADGGIWKSTNKGASWAPIMDNENAISMGAIAVDPINPNAIYAGTGEMSSNVDAYTGAGIFKSVDGGVTWRSIGLTSAGAFSRIVIPAKGNGSLIFAGVTKNNSGLYRSTDNGNTWSRRLPIAVSDITVDPTNEKELWVGTMGEGIYHSTDKGETFVKASTGLAPSGSSLERISVQVAPSNPNILFALSFETDGSGNSQVSHSRIYRSTDRGANWTQVFDDPTDFLNNPGSPQGWYNNVIAVQPNDPNIVVAGGVNLARTTDGGTTWKVTNVYFTSGAPHADQHAMAFDPANPSRLYLGNDGGVYRSEDAGKTYADASNGLAITQFYSAAIDPVSVTPKGYGGTQDNGTVTLDSRQLRDGDGFYVAIDHQNPNIIYTEREGGSDIRRIDVVNNISTVIMAGIDDADTAAWSAPLVIDPVDANTLWHGRHYLYTSLSRGDVWLRTDAKFLGEVSAIGVSQVDHNVVYGGSDRGELQVSRDGGANWTNESEAPGFPNRAVTDVIPSRASASTAYLSTSGFYSGHVFKTTDYGATWTDISKGLPDIPVNALELHPSDEQIIYAGTDIGMFISIDGGATWAPYNQGLPRVAVADLQLHRPSGSLIMASHGRSMWQIGLEKPELTPAIVAPAGGEVWMGGTSNIISWSGFPAGQVKIEFSPDDGSNWFPLLDAVVGNSILWKVRDTAVDNARIRVTSKADPGKSAVSRSFTITRFQRGGVITATSVPITPYGIAYNGSYLWVSDFSSHKLVKLNPTTLERAGSLTMSLTFGDSNFTDITYDPGRQHFFIHKLNNSTDDNPYGLMYEMDTNGKEIGRWISPCQYPTGLVYLPPTPTVPERLIATDRNGDESIYIYDPADPGTVLSIVRRSKPIRYGPRGASRTPGGDNFYQGITDFTGGTALKNAYVAKIGLDGSESPDCSFSLSSPASSGFINVRGIEFDPRDSNLWVSDFEGNVYKVASCDGSVGGDVTGGPTSVPVPALPAGFALEQNVPNPFTSTTTIRFTLGTAAVISLDLFNESGRMVAQLASGRMEAGEHSVTFDPAGLPSGAYHYILSLGGGAGISRTMIHVK